MEFPPEVGEEINSAIKAKTNQPCARCLGAYFALSADGFVTLAFTASGAPEDATGTGIRCVAVLCANCGHVNLHSLDKLELGYWFDGEKQVRTGEVVPFKPEGGP